MFRVFIPRMSPIFEDVPALKSAKPDVIVSDAVVSDAIVSDAAHQASTMVVDGHVHIHPCFDVPVLLKSALANFRRNVSSSSQPFATSNSGSGVAFLLALSESQGQNAFARLRAKAQSKDDALLENWQISLTDEADSLCARRLSDDGSADGTLYILAGRQIVTREGIEVLALATDRDFAEGHPMADTIQAVLSGGGISVIPWGFGKWLGKRGRRLAAWLRRQRHSLGVSPGPALFLADSSSRPTFWPEPALFEQARQNGLSILSGTDPFPFRSEMGRVGCAGFTVSGAFEPRRPAASLRQALAGAVPSSLAVYGSPEPPFRCLRNQLAMQFIKRFRSHA